MKIQYGENLIEMDDRYMGQDYAGRGIADIEDGANVYMSCFCHEEPDTAIFREDMTGVTFYNCNLDNVVIPKGNTVIGGTQNRFKRQNDAENWIVDENNEVVEPFEKKRFIMEGRSIDPVSIPDEKLDEPLLATEYKELTIK